MSYVLSLAGMSRQGLHKQLRPSLDAQEQEQVCKLMTDIRKKHKHMSARKVYKTYHGTLTIGRDRFIKKALSLGFGVKRKRSPIKTTTDQTNKPFPNLINGKTINGIDQVYQSDIFYIHTPNGILYGFTVEDIYSRELLGLVISTNMKAYNLILTLKQAQQYRGKKSLVNTILHSDKGGQYKADKFIELAYETLKMKGSMCDKAQQNAYVERLQGILKHEYLDDMKITRANCASVAKKVKELYNKERPHLSLNYLTPHAYSLNVQNTPKVEAKDMTVYKWTEGYPQKEPL